MCGKRGIIFIVWRRIYTQEQHLLGWRRYAQGKLEVSLKDICLLQVWQQRATMQHASVRTRISNNRKKTYHVNEAEAVEIHKDIQSKLSVGMHWGTFDLTAESPIVPEKNLEQLVKGTTVNFITMKHGATLTLPD